MAEFPNDLMALNIHVKKSKFKDNKANFKRISDYLNQSNIGFKKAIRNENIYLINYLSAKKLIF